MADYSIFSSDIKKSKGRMFLEEEDVNRSCFMRDRDRIIHSSAFRRLKYKTQVFVNNEEDYYRTRLSHSLEVSQLARSISKVFKVFGFGIILLSLLIFDDILINILYPKLKPKNNTTNVFIVIGTG